MPRTRRFAVLLALLTLLMGNFPATSAADVYFDGAYGLPDLGWNQINPRPISEALLSVAYGAGRWVAASEHNIYTSPDGELWTRTAPFQSQMAYQIRVVFSRDRFLLTNGVDGLISFDGEAWTPAPGLTDLAVVAEGCVAIIKERLAKSADCQTWVATGANEPFERIGYGDGTFFAYGGYYRKLYASADGAEWAAVDPGEWAPKYDYGQAPFLLARGAFVVTTTENGNHRPAYPGQMDEEVQAVARGNDRFLLLQRGGQVLSSVDGARWSEAGRLPTGTWWFDLAAGPDGFVAIGGVARSRRHLTAAPGARSGRGRLSTGPRWRTATVGSSPWAGRPAAGCSTAPRTVWIGATSGGCRPPAGLWLSPTSAGSLWSTLICR